MAAFNTAANSEGELQAAIWARNLAGVSAARCPERTALVSKESMSWEEFKSRLAAPL